MKKHRLKKPKEKIVEIFRRRAGDLCEPYTEVVRLRNVIERLAACETKAGDRSDHDSAALIGWIVVALLGY